jgi:CheY-like chemotaxis protein
VLPKQAHYNRTFFISLLFISVSCSSFNRNHIQSFKLYASSHPLMPAGQEWTDEQENDEGNNCRNIGSSSFPKAIAVQYHSKAHKELLWPLKVAQEQVKKKFLGVNYWTGMLNEMKESQEASSIYLPSEAASFHTYVNVLLALAVAPIVVSKLPPPPPSSICSSNSSSARSSPVMDAREIVEANGIYTYLHDTSMGVGRSNYSFAASPRNVVHLHSPVDHLIKGTSASTAARRFQSPENRKATSNTSSPEEKKKSRSRSDPDLREFIPSNIECMAGLNILIIEDSKLQRKMMRHQLCKTDSLGREDKEDREEKDDSVKSSTKDVADPSPPIPAANSSLLPVPVPLATAVSLPASERGGVWTVSEAANGETAIQMIIDTKSSFDVIFVDENLQHSGGNMLGHEVI